MLYKVFIQWIFIWSGVGLNAVVFLTIIQQNKPITFITGIKNLYNKSSNLSWSKIMNRKGHKYSSKLYLVGNHLSPWKVNHKGCGVSFFLTLSEHITIVYCSPEPLYVFDFNFCVHVVYFMLAWHVCCVSCWFVRKLSEFCFCL